MKKIPSYSKETALFAFVEICQFFHTILPENEKIFNQLSDKTINSFLSHVFKNDYTYYIKDEMGNRFFNNKGARKFYEYLKSSHSNKIFDHFIEQLCLLTTVQNNLYPTLFPEEIREIIDLKKEHDFLVLDKKFATKVMSKRVKI